MSGVSLDRWLRTPRFASDASGSVGAATVDTSRFRAMRIARIDVDALEGRVREGRARGTAVGDAGPSLSRRLSQRTARLRPDRAGHPGGQGMAFDARQRAVVKVHYYNHGGGGGAALRAHVRYVARDAGRGEDEEPVLRRQGRDARETDIEQGRAHADYLARGESHSSPFYDAKTEGVDGAARALDWAARDRRHFRLILSAERGELLGDLPAFTREVMARAEADLGTSLQWVAVDHNDTDNPHTHLILRGRHGPGRFGGQDLVLPRDFVRHGLRDIARDVATEWLGGRSPEDERLALETEIRRHAPTRLDRIIAHQLTDEGGVRTSRLAAPDGDPVLTQALKARAKELTRLGLATETRSPGRGGKRLIFQPDWQEQLKRLELHLDIRKRLMAERTAERQADLARAARRVARGVER